MSYQHSISRFFQASPQKQISKVNGSPSINKDQGQDEAEVKRQLEIDEKNKQLAIQRSERFKFDKTYKQGELTQEQILIQDQFRQKLNQKSFRERFNNDKNQNNNDIDDEKDDEDDEDEPLEQPKLKKAKKTKMTPLDQQVKELKLQHLDKILAIQVGYKYKFYCQDAVKVHKILNIMLVPGKLNLIDETPNDLMYNKLAYCSIPEPRLHIHLQRLLDAGFKIGVVNQIESPTIKSLESGSSSTLFKREISNVFTKATYLEFDEKNSGIKNDKTLDSIVAIYEDSSSGVITLVSVQPLMGNIIYDEFKDDFTRNELQTRLSHLEPLEFLYFEENLSRETLKCLSNFMIIHPSIRNITIHSSRRNFYKNYLNDYIEDSIVEFMVQQSLEFQLCCSILIDYLKEFHLDSCFKIMSNYICFNQSNNMVLNSNSLENLEIFQNSTNLEEYGSLIWVLDHTRTKFGYRMLKNWISKPLISRELIEERLDSVQEISSNFNHYLENFAAKLKNCNDLEKILNRIHYGVVKRKELYIFLKKLVDFEDLIIKFGGLEILKNLNSNLLKTSFKEIIELLTDFEPSKLIQMINAQSALDEARNDHVISYFKLDLLAINKDDLIQQDLTIENIKEELQSELKQIRNFFKRPSMDFVEKSREPYLIEVRNSHCKLVPKDWIKINSTKLVSRFRSPETIKLMKQLAYHQELYLQACHSVFKRFVSRIDESYTELNIIIKNLSTFDCLLSLSSISSQQNFNRPKFVDVKTIDLTRSRNPILETLSSNHIPNDIKMDSNSSHLIITGPNMGGKSSIVKQIALIQIMAQIGCFVPAESATLSVFNSILTRMGAQDDLMKGESTFYTEMSQVYKILESLEKSVDDDKSLVILDEVGRGTGTVDGISLAHSILTYLLMEERLNKKSVVLFITHFPSLCSLSEKYKQLKNYHMSYIEEKIHGTDWPRVTFLYELQKGVSLNSYGLNVAKLAGIDDDILDRAFIKSQERYRQVEENKLIKNMNTIESQLTNLFKHSDQVDLPQFWQIIDSCI